MGRVPGRKRGVDWWRNRRTSGGEGIRAKGPFRRDMKNSEYLGALDIEERGGIAIGTRNSKKSRKKERVNMGIVCKRSRKASSL